MTGIVSSPYDRLSVWLVTGSQHLYGEQALQQVAQHAQRLAAELSQDSEIPVKVVYQPVLTTAEAIRALCLQANAAEECGGLITWMHTFSPAQMWIAGLSTLRKPFAHLHTQFNRDIPWSSLDMDFMNLNQSAHGGREFGHVCSRLGLRRTVIVGHWQADATRSALGSWCRAAVAWHDWQGAKVARLGDNMRDVAVTEGDKVEAQIRLGFSVQGYGLGDLVQHVEAAGSEAIHALLERYEAEYEIAPPLRAGGAQRDALREAARIEVGLRSFLQAGRFRAFTDTFENLHGLRQLPGIAVQRLMADGYGFGAEGDWKTAALVRAVKVLGHGLPGGTSFMEDYTYHFHPAENQVLGAHMLEICPSIAAGQPVAEIHPLSIGGKEDPVRLVFDAPPGPGLNAALLDLGDRFRLLVNAIQVVAPAEPLPHLPVARAVWVPQPDLPTAAAAWILAGGPHHTAFSQAVTCDHLEAFAELAGIECLRIEQQTRLTDIKNALRWNEAYYHQHRG